MKQFVDGGGARSLLTPQLLLFVPLIANVEGLEEIAALVPEVSCDPVRMHDDSDMAFAAGAAIFESDEERTLAQEVFTNVGDAVNPEHPLGWEGLQSLVVFPHAVPNATLPALWRGGEYDGGVWKPLFAR